MASPDIPESGFGVTLKEGDEAVSAQGESPDRHHKGEVLTQIAIESPVSEVDFLLKPFNRQDVYSFNLFIVIPKDKREAKYEIQLSTQHSVKFVLMPIKSHVAGNFIGAFVAEFVKSSFR